MDNGQVLTRSVPTLHYGTYTCTLNKTDTQLGFSPAWVERSLQRAFESSSWRGILCAPCRHSEPVGCRANLRMTSWPTIRRHMACDVPYQSPKRIYLPASPAHITIHPELLPV